MNDEVLNSLSRQVIGSCIEVHKLLGPGLLESVYTECLCLELDSQGIKYLRESIIPVEYKGSIIETLLRADIIVEDQIIVELKSVNDMIPIYDAQLLTYLKLSNRRLGLLINFNVLLLKDGIKRIVNPYYASMK